ncbi:MAG: Radical SAM domain-containing protein [Candidatus Magnetoglobus multicellularis str. Araruama]|uniref:Radical SAM domain-containing protein n=1 Tax=Candidatus Magnetoglobus multicellularis str. Araruama TaxID=890399 RepID=A0A1V1PDH1_9BACT|nr:MAG: Radical SAM domain-containing protein [Candidatus Magnetoglobus multicellularis str. Araruama]
MKSHFSQADRTFLHYCSNNNDLQVLFHPFHSSWVIANPTATQIIKQIAAHKTIEQIAQGLAKDYEIDRHQALHDVQSVKQTIDKNSFDLNDLFTPKQRKPELKSLFIHITRRCNLHCPHCYIASTDHMRDLSVSTIHHLIETLINQGGTGVTISGGEPLIHPDIKCILSHAAEKLTVRLLTNGTMIDKNMAAFLADQGIYVQISLDGSSARIHDAIRGDGAFGRVMDAIHLLQEQGAGDRLNLCTTLMQQNADDWLNIIQFAEKTQIPLLRFLHLRTVGRAYNHPKAYPLKDFEYEQFIAHINQIQQNSKQSVELTCGMSGLLLKMPDTFKSDDIWCPVGRMMVIDTNGNVYPCVLMMRDAYYLGNIFQTSLIEMIQSRQMHDICHILSHRRFMIQKCQECAFRNLCQAGCMGQALDHCNSLMETDLFCKYRQKAYATAFDRLLCLDETGQIASSKQSGTEIE